MFQGCFKLFFFAVLLCLGCFGSVFEAIFVLGGSVCFWVSLAEKLFLSFKLLRLFSVVLGFLNSQQLWNTNQEAKDMMMKQKVRACGAFLLNIFMAFSTVCPKEVGMSRSASQHRRAGDKDTNTFKKKRCNHNKHLSTIAHAYNE